MLHYGVVIDHLRADALVASLLNVSYVNILYPEEAFSSFHFW